MGSNWAKTKTFFPLLLAELQKRDCRNVCVVGAADGKFVLPLAGAGFEVMALDIDETALYGGQLTFPGGRTQHSPGLVDYLNERGLANRVTVKHVNILDFECDFAFDAIFTSCSWHYSTNHETPVREYVRKMQALVRYEGVFCAEYMMPVEAKHFKTDHYMHEDQLRSYFNPTDWQLLEEFYTTPFVEAPHVGNLSEHVHRMGFLMAERLKTPSC